MNLNEAKRVLEDNGYIVEGIFNKIADKIGGKPTIVKPDMMIKFEDENAEKLYKAIVIVSKEIGLKVNIDKEKFFNTRVYYRKWI